MIIHSGPTTHGNNVLTNLEGAAMPWIAPGPPELPDLRTHMRDFIGTAPGLALLAYQIISSERNRIFAVLPGPQPTPLTTRSGDPRPMAALEARRLGEAQLYWVDDDMTSLALAAAACPSGELVKARRMPAESGLMVFAQPIGSYVNNIGAGVAKFHNFLADATTSPLGDWARISCPIVAVSWSSWNPRDVRLTDQPSSTWAVRTLDGYDRVPPGCEWIWLTFYTTGGSGWGMLPADTVINNFGGVAITAGYLAKLDAQDSRPRLLWETELLLEVEKPLPTAQPDSPEQWAHVVYTAWQLMSQTGNAQLTEVESVARQRHGRKRDQRARITNAGTVQLVRVHTRHRPSTQASAEDAAASDGRQAPQWTCRWPVRPYRRNTCLNTHAHAEGGCEHEERIVPGHIKGPADQPLKVGPRVHIWDTPPPEP